MPKLSNSTKIKYQPTCSKLAKYSFSNSSKDIKEIYLYKKLLIYLEKIYGYIGTTSCDSTLGAEEALEPNHTKG